MEHIGDTMKKITRRPDFQQRYEKMKQEILRDPHVRAFLEKHHGQITQKMIDRSINKLYEFTSQSKGCSQCESVASCKNIIPGYEPELVLKNNSIDVHYVPCRLKLMEDERKKMERLIRCLYLPKDTLDASLSNVFLDTESRMYAVEKSNNLFQTMMANNFKRLIFVWGVRNRQNVFNCSTRPRISRKRNSIDYCLCPGIDSGNEASDW